MDIIFRDHHNRCQLILEHTDFVDISSERSDLSE